MSLYFRSNENNYVQYNNHDRSAIKRNAIFNNNICEWQYLPKASRRLTSVNCISLS